METKSLSRLLSLLELGGQTALVRISPAGTSPATEDTFGAAPSTQGGFPPTGPTATWYAELYILTGALQYAAVFTPSGGRRLVGDQALNFLGQIGGLSYELLPLPARPALPPSAAVTSPLPDLPPGYHDRYPQTPEPPAHPPSPRLPPWASPGAPALNTSWRPVRTRWGEQMLQHAQQLTRDQRRVLSLINGQRTIDELSRLLGFSAESLWELLLYFKDQNIIA